MIIADNWQQFIYDKAKKEIDSNGRYKFTKEKATIYFDDVEKC